MPEGPAAAQLPREGLTTRRNQPLIGVPTKEGPDEVVRYFTSEEEADEALSRDKAGIERALSLAGAWKHIDDEGGPDMLDELDRMRHETKPTPPFKL
jgi:hypothetical protein